MGIPHYFYVITKNYPGIIHLTKPKECNHYFLDFNGLVHHSVHEILKKYKNEMDNSNKSNQTEYIQVEDDIIEKEIMENCWEYLNECIKVAQPNQMVHICIDGVAPIAKMNQQRKRRYLSVFQSNLKGEKRIWDTNAVSPGTKFMTKLKAFLSAKIRDSRAKYIYFLSSADDPGEGEHKIMARIASLKESETVYIYGLDADLIMLSLLSHHKNIYLMREPQHSGKELTVNKDNTENGFIYLDIHALRIALIQELHMTYQWPLSDECKYDPFSQDAKNCIETYVVMCFLLGNDFLPHIPCLSLKKNGHTQILKATAMAWQLYESPCVENNKIHTAFLLQVLQILKSDETRITLEMNNEYYKKYPYPNHNQSGEDDPSHCYPIKTENKDPLAEILYTLPDNSISLQWRSIYYKHLFFTKKNNTSIIADSSRIFIEGIYWTYAYYKRLPCKPSWYYPYGYSPTIQDLAHNVQANLNDYDILLESWKKDNYTHEFVDQIVQLLSILPYESKHLIPYNSQKFMIEPKYGCSHLFPRTYNIQTYLKTHLWECVPVLPPLDIQLIQFALRKF